MVSGCRLRQSSQKPPVEDLPDHPLPEIWHVLLRGHEDILNFRFFNPGPTLSFWRFQLVAVAFLLFEWFIPD